MDFNCFYMSFMTQTKDKMRVVFQYPKPRSYGTGEWSLSFFEGSEGKARKLEFSA